MLAIRSRFAPSWHTDRVIGRLLSPRALGLLALAVVLIAAMVVLGRWQFGVYDDSQRADALAMMERDPVPLDRVLGPDEAFPADAVGRPVAMSGRYDVSGQLYIRDLAGSADEYAVATPLLTDTGSAVLVIRGSSPVPQSPAPAGAVDVTGTLQPSQPDAASLDGQRITDAVTISQLVGSVEPDLYSAYVVLTSSMPAEKLSAVEPPLPSPSRWAGLRNLLYAMQWWVFAAFVAFMWWRIASDPDPADEVPRSGSVAP